MRKLILFMALLALPFVLGAQYNKISYKTASNARLIQIDQYDDASVFHFVYTSDGVDTLKANHNVKIYFPDTEEAYKLLDTENLPDITSGVECQVVFNNPGQEMNFIMVFEKIPLDRPFNIETGSTAAGPHNFYFTNVSVDPSSCVEQIDKDSFISKNPAMAYAKVVNNGFEFHLHECNGLSVSICCVCIESLGEKVQRFFVDVMNRSGKDVEFKWDNLKFAWYDKDMNYSKIEAQSGRKFAKELKSAGFWTKLATYTSPAGLVVSTISPKVSAPFIASNSAFTIMCSTPEEYTSKEYRAIAEKWYAKDTDIKAGQDYSCYFNMKNVKKMQGCIVSLEINGTDFRFDIPVSHKIVL